ncbi:MAG: DUF4242 domain-containing protein [Thermoplasmatota archaeon]
MPLYMDVHSNVAGLTAAMVAEAHQRDLAHQGKHGVEFVKYWYDGKKGKIFCLSKAPNAEAAKAVHRDAGHPSDEIYQVSEGN